MPEGVEGCGFNLGRGSPRGGSGSNGGLVDDFENINQIEEIWHLRSFGLWLAKHCLLSHYFSHGLYQLCTGWQLHGATSASKFYSLFFLFSATALIIITSYELAVRLYVAPSPGWMGYSAAVERFLKVLAMVWAGSQVTKLMRAGGGLALALFIRRGLLWFTVKFGFESHGKAFVRIAGFCFGLAFVMFVVITVRWA